MLILCMTSLDQDLMERNLHSCSPFPPHGTLRILETNSFLCLLLLSPHHLKVCILSPGRSQSQLLCTNHLLAEVFGGSPERRREKKIRKISISGPLLFSLIIRGAVTPSLFFRRRSIIRSIQSEPYYLICFPG